ncbi:MAG: PadR family transcriptional regulator [Chloroflexi bacterium]|nr:PadR family transcriptional regulator [Chloroflexota bacterium]MCL5276061.1 PadR family transcriptional regulator [Chloroflexota bacterium]
MLESQQRSSYTGALSPEYALLGFLALREAHGYGLHQQLVQELGQVWHVSLSQTYNILGRLERQGYISGSMMPQDKLPARRTYHLTQAGRRRFDQWLQSPSGCSVHAIRVEFSTRLYFALLLQPGYADELIDLQVKVVQGGLQRMRKALSCMPPEQTVNRLGLSLRIRQLTSVAEWLTECRTALGPAHDMER